MQAKQKGRMLCLALSLCLSAVCAQAESSEIDLSTAGLRYLSLSEESCVTQDAPQPELLDWFGLNEQSFHQDGLLMATVQESGQQWTLSEQAAPTGYEAADYWSLQEDERVALLDELCVLYEAEGDWAAQPQGYALLSRSVKAHAAAGIPAMQMSDLIAVTLHQGRLLALKAEVIGRDITGTDEQALLDSAERLLFLHPCHAEESAALSLPQTDEVAPIEVINDELALSIDPVAKAFPSTTLILSGITEKSTPMRYYVNGKSSSRFYSKEDGSFRVTVPSLQNGESNKIDVVVYEDNKGPKRAEASFTIDVERQQPPVVFARHDSATTEGKITVQGLTLAGAKVALGQRTKGTKLTADKATGAFTLDMALPNLGENSVTLTVTANGYSKGAVVFSVFRLPENSGDLRSLLDTTGSLPYEQLIASPQEYSGALTVAAGEVSLLANRNGKPCFLLSDGAGRDYAVETDDLTPLHLGEQLSALLSPCGDTADWFGSSVPRMRLLAFAIVP